MTYHLSLAEADFILNLLERNCIPGLLSKHSRKNCKALYEKLLEQYKDEINRLKETDYAKSN